MMHEEAVLPLAVDDLTRDWLETVLQKTMPDLEVRSMNVVDVRWGTATKVLVHVEYKRDLPGGPPADLWVKGCLDERVRAHVGGEIYVMEAHFYGDLAGELDIPLPKAWYAAADAQRTQGIVVFEHLDGRRATFGEIGGKLMTPDEVAAGLETQARWHGATFGVERTGRFPWLKPGGAFRPYVVKQLDEAYWDAHFARPDAVVLPPAFCDRSRITQAFDKLWQVHDRGPHCLIHGDAHVGNTYVDAQGRTGFFDWQTPCLGPWGHDVAYFVVSALSVDDRRKHERDLLVHYLDILANAGGPAISFDDAWNDYVIHNLYGFMWALTSPDFNALDRTVAMAKLHIAAIEDHDPMAALARLA